MPELPSGYVKKLDEIRSINSVRAVIGADPEVNKYHEKVITKKNKIG